MAGQEFVENHAEGVEVRRRRDGLAAHLLRRGVLRRHRPNARLRQRRPAGAGLVAAEHLGNAEVEQLELAVLGHEHVRGLEVAMDDEAAVGVLHRAAHLLEQPQAALYVEVAGVAESVNGTPSTYSMAK